MWEGCGKEKRAFTSGWSHPEGNVGGYGQEEVCFLVGLHCIMSDVTARIDANDGFLIGPAPQLNHIYCKQVLTSASVQSWSGHQTGGIQLDFRTKSNHPTQLVKTR